MAEQGQPTTKGEKKLMYNYAAAFLGVLVGALGGTMLLGPQVNNPPLAAAIGAVVGGVIGFSGPHIFRLLKAH